MISKVSINQRFKEAVEFLIKSEKSLNKTSIAEKLDISKSKFSEILNNRMNIGVEDLALFAFHYKIDPNWLLLGIGEIKAGYVQELHSALVEEPKIDSPNLQLLIESKNETINSLQKIIQMLENEKDFMRKLIDASAGKEKAV